MNLGIIQSYAYFYNQKKMDITESIIESIKHEEGLNNICVNIGPKTVQGYIDISDDRIWKSPSHNSCDGLPTLVSGKVTYLLDVEVIDEDSNIHEHTVDDNKIHEHLNEY